MPPVPPKPKNTYQPTDEPVNVAMWGGEPYSEGARAKDKHFCSPENIHQFLLPNHPYLFKRSIERTGHEEQFYCEVIAFLIGQHIDVPVPPAFVSFNSDTGESGALIQWFYNPDGDGAYQVKFVHGTEYGLRMTKNFDPDKGTKHSANLMFCLCRHFHARRFHTTGALFEHWFKIFAFDALIGNTDRHAHNWGVLFHADERKEYMSFSPAFDNGTSLGYEQLKKNFWKFDDDEYLYRYVERGCHHVKWVPSDKKRIGHLELLQRIIDKYPSARGVILKSLSFDFDKLEEKIWPLTKFDIPVKLSPERCRFILKLISARQNYLWKGVI